MKLFGLTERLTPRSRRPQAEAAPGLPIASPRPGARLFDLARFRYTWAEGFHQNRDGREIRADE
jgi:hypothetical protein